MRITTTILMTIFAPALLGAQQVQANASGSADVEVQTGSAHSVAATGDAAADVRIQNAVSRAQAEGIATAGLESRVRMGTARGVDAARVASAVEARVEALLASRSALNGSAAARSDAMVELGADAIESGAHASQVAEVAAGFAGESGPRALAVLGSLAAQGRVGANATAAVRSALDAGVTGNAGATAAGAAAGSGATAGASTATSAAVGAGNAAGRAGASVTGAAGGVLPR